MIDPTAGSRIDPVTAALNGHGGQSGAQGRNRTTDTAIFSRMLYQLSYLGLPLEGRA
jgi:hypothetical protein